MSLLLRNTQRKFALNIDAYRTHTLRMKKAAGCADWDLAITLTTDHRLRALNLAYRKIDKTTDILSFPFYEQVPVGCSVPVHGLPIGLLTFRALFFHRM
jgi:ssRNA-specific RNase YbeY (16S rRNA maturation enzyme)